MVIMSSYIPPIPPGGLISGGIDSLFLRFPSGIALAVGRTGRVAVRAVLAAEEAVTGGFGWPGH